MPTLCLVSSAPSASNEAESAFLGNGDQGLLIRCDDADPMAALRFTLGRTTLYDDREPYHNYTVGNFAVDRPRLPIGYMRLETAGRMVEGAMRTRLYDGTTHLNLTTTTGTLNITAFVNARFDVADVQVYRVQRSGGECAAAWAWNPLPADAEIMQPSNYVPNPPPVNGTMTAGSLTVNYSTWTHLSGKTHSVAFTVVPVAGTACDHTMVLVATNVSGNSLQVAVGELQKAASAMGSSAATLETMHSQWWNSFYPRSGLSFSGYPAAEQFYFISVAFTRKGSGKKETGGGAQNWHGRPTTACVHGRVCCGRSCTRWLPGRARSKRCLTLKARGTSPTPGSWRVGVGWMGVGGNGVG
jgi:hypothetical protein